MLVRDPVAQKHLAKLKKYRGEYDEWGNRISRTTHYLLGTPDSEKRKKRRIKKKKQKEEEEKEEEVEEYQYSRVDEYRCKNNIFSSNRTLLNLLLLLWTLKSYNS